MMSEKRFKFCSDDYLVGIIDTATGKKLNHFATIDLLNDQQATISALKEENIELKKLRKYCAEWMGVKEENLYDVVR